MSTKVFVFLRSGVPRKLNRDGLATLLERPESQTFAVMSQLAVTIREPSGLNDAEATQLVCPLSVRTSAPLRASQTFAVLSSPPVTTREPSGLNDAEKRGPACPLSVRISAPLWASQTFAVESALAVTTREPSGLNDAELDLSGVPLEREGLGAALGRPRPSPSGRHCR